ncbi:MAG: hypothetical protein K6F39_06335 [Lachnospiraceae bacterium]|nr:hypothetical protein [Lachnospiraceae bacterium]
MSILGDKLTQYIDESGYSVNKLAMLSGVNRTSIVRMINANRLPEQHNIEKLIPYLKLTVSQREDLWRTYEVMSVGEHLYERRQFILRMMKEIFNPFFNTEEAIDNRMDSGNPSIKLDHNKICSILHGRYEVANAITVSMLTQPDNDICIYAPFTVDYISDFFKHLASNKSSTVHIRHAMHFIKNPDRPGDINFNINILSHVLPLGFANSIDYNAYFTYVTTPLICEAQIPYPYYIIIGDILAQFSQDFENAILINDPELVAEYKRTFNKNIENAYPLIRYGNNLHDLIEFFPPTVIKRSGFCKFGTQPWLLSMFELKDALKTLPSNEQTRELVEEISKHAPVSGKKIDAHISFFSKSGLLDFTEKGVLTGYPQEYVRIVPPDQRLKALEHLKCECERDGYIIRVMNETTFPMISNISIQVTQDNHLGITIVNDENTTYKAFFMDEPTLMESFTDFLEYAANSPFLCANIVCSKDKTINFIDECIAKLQ